MPVKGPAAPGSPKAAGSSSSLHRSLEKGHSPLASGSPKHTPPPASTPPNKAPEAVENVQARASAMPQQTQTQAQAQPEAQDPLELAQQWFEEHKNHVIVVLLALLILNWLRG